MLQRLTILLAIAMIVGLPFLFRREELADDWAPGDPELVIVTPHNEAIRYEFGRAFSKWYRAKHGRSVRVDWRVVGGTSEIMRYLEAEYVAAFRAWWMEGGHAWPAGGGETVLDRKFDPARPPADAATNAAVLAAWEATREFHQAFRKTDDAAAFSSKVDVFFGGGTYDHDKAGGEGLTVPAWPTGQPPPGTLFDGDGRTLIPAALSGEIWRSDTYYGTVLSTFGICYNPDRLRDLGVREAPQRWEDLANPALIGQVAMADPSKSGSIAKAFEMIVHQQCWEAVRAAGFGGNDVTHFEGLIKAAKLAPGKMPEGVPIVYQQAIEDGWLKGLRLVQRIGANARYLTDSGGKVAIDVSVGDAAAGIGIDFFSRYQSELSRAPDGTERLVYVTPRGGSSVSADPVSLLRGAAHRELALEFIAFVLGEDGQKLWNYEPGTAGGPEKFALRRLPIRRDFYPTTPDARDEPSNYPEHQAHYTDDLGSPEVNPYQLGAAFVYQPRWTGAHFNVMRDLVRVMCLDAGDELREAWSVIQSQGGPAEQAEALALLGRMPDSPVPLTWVSALSIPREYDRIDYMREWTVFFRKSCREAKERSQRSKVEGQKSGSAEQKFGQFEMSLNRSQFRALDLGLSTFDMRRLL